jgi:type II secretory pathway pseudopilin PulG
MMKNENGYVLLIVLVIVCVITLAIIGLMTRTTDASFLAAKRVGTVQAFSLAESAAMEGYWYLVADPAYRVINQERLWSTDKYSFSIIDSAHDDMHLEVLGAGFVGNQQRSVRLTLSRPDVSSTYSIDTWQEDN